MVGLALLAPSFAGAAPVEVRFLEGITRGFLVLRSTTGQTVAQGDLIQTAHALRRAGHLLAAPCLQLALVSSH